MSLTHMMCVVFSCVNIGFPYLWQTIMSEKNQVISYLYDNSTVPMFIHIEYMFWFMFLMIQLCTIRAPTWSIVRPISSTVCEYKILTKVRDLNLVCRSCVYLFFELMMWDYCVVVCMTCTWFAFGEYLVDLCCDQSLFDIDIFEYFGI